MAKRGRPKKEVQEAKLQWEDRYENGDGTVDVWKWDLTKRKNGPISTETIYPKGYRPETPKLDQLGKQTVVVVYKTSERKNAKWSIKTITSRNIDHVLRGKGLPKKAIIVEAGVGESLKEIYSNKYKKELKK